ncbi:MAG TPA: hypothetical protein VIG33_04530 [Pseudobdellovibrionaceae bacterium]|jgi:hypothetical protein
MHFQLIFLLFLFPAFSYATLQTTAEFMEQSHKTRETLSKDASFKKIADELQTFEKSLNTAIQEYEKDSPLEGGDEEEKVFKLSFGFKNIFNLAKQKSASKEACEKAKHQIEFEDKSGLDEDAKLSEAAEEALKWLELLCKTF